MDFKSAYPGDNPNRAWVRDAMERKGIKVDYRDVILRHSAAHVRWLFETMMRENAPWDLISQHFAAEEDK